MQTKGILILINISWKCKSVQILQKSVWRFLKKLKKKQIYNIAQLMSIYPKNPGQHIMETLEHQCLYKSIHNSYVMERTFMSNNRFFLSIKKNEVTLFSGKQIQLDIIILRNQASLRKISMAFSLSLVILRFSIVT